MKFERISLEKYGAIATREIDLADKAGLVIIFGPNEAGKSTLLCAISDLLYGVPHTSSHGGIFGNNQIRIEASLRLADGSGLTLRRKKGRPPGDLVDENDAPVPSAQMEAMLNGTDRDRFSALFGLDHVSLRDGGQKLLASDGEIGRLIIEAGGGLRALVTALTDLEKEADGLFSSKRSAKRQFYMALDAFQAADKAVRQATTTREAFLKSQRAALAAAASLAALRGQQAGARESIVRLGRLKRTAPQLQLFAQTEMELREFADIEEFADGLAIEIATTLDARKMELGTLASAEETVRGLQSQLDQLVIASDIVDAATEIDAVETLAVHVEKAKLDLPNRRSDLAESNSQLANLRSHLGLDADQDLEALAPSRAAIEEVHSLASEEITLRSALASASDQLAECKENLDAIRQRQTERAAKGFDKPAPVSATDLLRLASLALDLDLKSRQITDKQTAIDTEAQALGLNSSELSRNLWPSVAQVNSELDRATAVDGELRQADSARKAASKRSESAARRLTHLATGTQPPTPAAVTEARSDRDSVWDNLRSYYLDAPDEGWSRPPQDQRNKEASKFEHSRDAADALVDRRGAEAQRLADIASTEREKFEADNDVDHALQTIDDLKQRLSANQQAWSKLWPDAFAIERDLRLLLALTEARGSLIAQQSELELLSAGRSQLKVEVETLGNLLNQVEASSPPDPGASTAVRVQRAVAVLKAHDDQYGDYRRDADEIAKLVAREGRRQQEIEGFAEKQRKWTAVWLQAVSKLGLPDSVTPQKATEVATEWAGAAGVFSAIRITATRIQRIKEDDQKLEGAIGEFRKRFGAELPDDAVASARHLKRLLAESSGRKLQRDALLPQADKARLDQEAAIRRLQALDTVRLDLASKCDCEPDYLEALAPRIEKRRKLRIELDTIKQTIVAAGDGHSFQSLRDQWQRQDPDDLATQLAALDDEVAQRDNDIETAIALQQSADAEVRAFVDDDRLNGMIAEREAASAEMHQVIERYVEISLAQSLLKAAIEKVRHEQQDPLLARASELFSACTRGEFGGIETDVNGDGEPIVVGRRPGGDTVILSEMSDGTRDQLFLAFRLASIEHYAENAEPIPLIADDILVHFDDDRGRATLELLAEIGSATQVLLFTHHEAVVAAANKLITDGHASVVDLRT
tara:strand:- start:1930 stop:5412 length:3483 start_codon:yes stop_codon:yes gene_type:complete